MITRDLELDTWNSTGAVVLPDFLTGDRLAELKSWVDELENRPGSKSDLLQYDETTADGDAVRCRTENIVPFHSGMANLLTAGPVVEIASALLGEPAVLYKEKINYKNPGGAGFAPHQDAPAYPFVRSTITCMIAVDDSTQQNGCLDIVEGMHRDPLPVDDVGCIPTQLAMGMPWTPVPVRAGSLLWFNWYVPHRSGANTSDQRRRAIYLTYNAASDGDHRAKYYQEKQQRLEDGSGRISLIGHFEGNTKQTKSGDRK